MFHPSQTKNVYVSDGANFRLVRTEDVTGTNNIVYSYAGGRVTSITDSQGRVVTFGYSSSRNPTQPTTITDTSLSRTITLAYAGPGGALSSVTDATGAVTTWEYGTTGAGTGKVISVTNSGTGERTDISYDSSTRVATTVFGANSAAVAGTWTMGYPSGTQTTVTDSNSHTVTYNFTAGRQVTSVVDALAHTGNQVFNTHGDLTSRTNAASDVTTYDIATATFNLTKITSPAGGVGGGTARSTQFVFPTAVGNGATADYRPTTVTDSQSNSSTFTYNSWGQTVTDARGALGAGTPLGGTVTYQMKNSSASPATCANARSGQLCQLVDAKGTSTAYAYDTAGNLATLTPPAPLGVHTFGYDPAGRKISETDGRGNTATTCYDKDDRITQVSYTSAVCTTPSGVSYIYDTAGNVVTRSNPTGTTSYTFDAQNRTTARTGVGGTSAATYDRVSNVLTAVDGGTGAANTTSYRYDAANNLIALAEPGGSCPATPVIPNATKCTTFGYDNANRRLLTSYPTGVANTVTFSGGRIATITTRNSTATTLLSRAYTYIDSAGTNDTSLVRTVTDQAGGVNSYGYDQMNRLTTATATAGGYTTGSWAWTFDVNGNRTQQTVNGVVTHYGYNPADQLCWTAAATGTGCASPAGGTGYSYDGNGNQTSGGNTYSSFDQVTATTTGGAAAYTYGGTSNNERLTAGALTYTSNLANQLVQQTGTGGTTKFIRDPQGTLIAMQNSAGSSYYTTDNIGSVLLLTGAAQTAVAAYTYDPYGSITASSGTQAGNNPWRYATGYHDSLTGLTKLGARYYNPILGRYTQTDPSGQEQNNYAYAENNPTTNNDPTGLDADSCSGFLGCASDFLFGVDKAILGGVATGAVAGCLATLEVGCAPGAAYGAGVGAAGGLVTGIWTIWDYL